MNINKSKIIDKSSLYIVPTPIGNIKDITIRALDILNMVDIIIAENIYHTNFLLKKFNIKKPLFVLNKYNEKYKTTQLINKLCKGKNIAIVSNSGTPLINDPGYILVRNCHQIGINVIPLPGACAAITALSASGLSTNRFCYEGFLPKKRQSRILYLNTLVKEKRTLIFYESTHRIIECLQDINLSFGKKRYIVIAKELTKIYEKIYADHAENILFWIKKNNNKYGEFVLLIEGYKYDVESLSPTILKTLSLLLQQMKVKTAINLTAKIHEIKKNYLYKYYLNHIME